MILITDILNKPIISLISGFNFGVAIGVVIKNDKIKGIISTKKTVSNASNKLFDKQNPSNFLPEIVTSFLIPTQNILDIELDNITLESEENIVIDASFNYQEKPKTNGSAKSTKATTPTTTETINTTTPNTATAKHATNTAIAKNTKDTKTANTTALKRTANETTTNESFLPKPDSKIHNAKVSILGSASALNATLDNEINNTKVANIFGAKSVEDELETPVLFRQLQNFANKQNASEQDAQLENKQNASKQDAQLENKQNILFSSKQDAPVDISFVRSQNELFTKEQDVPSVRKLTTISLSNFSNLATAQNTLNNFSNQATAQNTLNNFSNQADINNFSNKNYLLATRQNDAPMFPPTIVLPKFNTPLDN